MSIFQLNTRSQKTVDAIYLTFLTLYFTVYEKPSNLNSVSSSISNSSFKVTWDEPPDGGGASTIKEYVVIWNPNQKEISNSSTREVELSGLKSNTNYTFTVVARNINNKDGAVSDAAMETTCKQFSYLHTAFL